MLRGHLFVIEFSGPGSSLFGPNVRQSGPGTGPSGRREGPEQFQFQLEAEFGPCIRWLRRGTRGGRQEDPRQLQVEEDVRVGEFNRVCS